MRTCGSGSKRWQTFDTGWSCFFTTASTCSAASRAVAGRGVVGQNDVARRLAADIVAVRAHVLEHVAVADRRAHERNAQIAEIALEAEIGHHGRDDAGLGETAVGLPAFGDHRQQLVAVDDAPALVDDEHAVGVAVERDADIGAHFLAPSGKAPRARSSRIRG